MPGMLRLVTIVIALGLQALSNSAAAGEKPHRVTIQVDQNDPP